MSLSLRERKNAILDEIRSLTAQVEPLAAKLAQGQQLTDEEAETYDAIVGRGTPDQPDHVPGKLEALQTSLKRILAFERQLEVKAIEKVEARKQEPAIPHPIPENLDDLTRQAARALLPQRSWQSKTPGAFESPEAALRCGAWIAASLYGSEKARQFCAAVGLPVQAAMSGGSDESGGALVPVELERAIIKNVETYGVFAGNARVVQMGSDTLQLVRGRTGIQTYFVGETPSSIGESSPKFDLVTLTARPIATRTLVSRDLAEDAFTDLASYVAEEIAWALAKKIDECGFLGDGTSTYGGMVGVASAIGNGSIAQAASGHVSFETLNIEDFTRAVAMLQRWALDGARWYVSSAGWAHAMLRLAAQAGGNTIDTLGGRLGPAFLGYPVVITQVLPNSVGNLAGQHVCYFGDLSRAAVLGIRGRMQFVTANELYLATRQIGLFGFMRFDLAIIEPGTATESGGIVALKAASS